MELRLTDYYQRSIFSCLQNEQVELGRENGLNEKEISVYASPLYNFRQMQEIRLAIEHDTDPKQRKAMCHARIPAEQMHEMRLRLERGELLRNPAVPAKVWAGVFAMIGAYAGLVMICMQAVNGPYLQLKQEEIVLEAGQPFQAMDYVESYSDGEGALILPSGIDTSEEGRKTAVYHFVSQSEDIMKSLVVSVVNRK